MYEGFEDRASHAFRGKTRRNAPMYEEGGALYVYLVYGLHVMLNIVAGPAGFPSAVLIREAGPYHGPAKLTRALGATCGLSGLRAGKESGVHILESSREAPEVERLARVGIAYAGEEWARKPLRFRIAP